MRNDLLRVPRVSACNLLACGCGHTGRCAQELGALGLRWIRPTNDHALGLDGVVIGQVAAGVTRP